MILYIIYNSDLVEVAEPTGRKEPSLAFVDDMVYIAVGLNFHETHNTLQDMLNRQGGGFEWSKGHNSQFETSKFGLMDFSRVLVDSELCWHAHAAYAISKGTNYVLQLWRLSYSVKGVPLSLMKQLYTSVALPKMLYAVDLWLTPLYIGSIGTVNKMERVQRLAVTSITGALKTTATDTMENHCHQAVLRISVHLKTHPLHPTIRRAARIYVRHHRSSLHHLTHTFRINPNNAENTQIPPWDNRGTYHLRVCGCRPQPSNTPSSDRKGSGTPSGDLC
ncbi:hypothetical protein BDN67DRAFT_992802 [Paxillus ammoniavirescens]|nr:hypothetical protein BDN67DRAFT_992802 [Paxillus ammoniavirescens]